MNAIQKWRIDQKLTLKQAAELLGISEPTVWRYETGDRLVSPERATHVSKVTGIPRAVLRPDIFGPLNDGD